MTQTLLCRSPERMTPDFISLAEKREALDRVLASSALRRSDQLRRFLRFVCEAEFEGRSSQINEYVVGISVLGRRSDYSPAEDSCVRTRAYELRNKLKGYYQDEAPDDPVQIEILKGGYVPRFERRSEKAQAESTNAAENSTSAPLTVLHAVKPTARLYFYTGAAAVVLIILTTSLVFYLSHSVRDHAGVNGSARSALTPEMAALWKPFLDNATPLLISFDTRLFFYAPSTGLVVRDFEANQPADLARSKPLKVFKTRMGANEMQETLDYADSGAVHGVFLLSRFLTQQHRDVSLKDSSSLGWEDLRNNNIIFIGKPNLNPSLRYVLNESDFVDDDGGTIIRNLHPSYGEAAAYRNAITHGEGDKYAVITVLPAPQPGHFIMVLDGCGSELMWALAASVTDPVYAREIMRHLPEASVERGQAFQVVIQATFESYVPIKVRYVTHHVFKRS